MVLAVGGFILIIPLLVIMYFLMIRPQQQRIRAQQEAIRSVQVGDEVVTAAGLIGTINALDDEVVHLQIADGVEVRVARMAIGRRVDDAGVVSDTDEDDLDDEDGYDEDVDLLEAEADGEDDHEPVDEDVRRDLSPPANGDRPGSQGDV